MELDGEAARHYIGPMFTGLVSGRGLLAGREERGPSARIVVRPVELPTLPERDEPLALGESIAIDGACLSVVQALPDGFSVDATAETLARTTLGGLSLGSRVNLERSVRAADRLGGHLVTGHVDGVGSLASRRAVGDALALSFAMPAALARFVAEKGSIAINGVSMTVNAAPAQSPSFDVMVIPITQAETNLGALIPGSPVNLEVDLVARYVARLIEARAIP
jgi:riboflavin synthase